MKLAGDSVAVIDPDTNTIVGEIPVGGRPTGPAVGEGSVWVGNRDDNTLLRIDPRSRKVVRMMGLGVAPTDIAVGAGSVWVLSDRALLQVDPATNHVVARRPLPQANGPGRWSHLETGANAVFVCSCTPPGNVIRLDPATSSVVTVHRSPVWELATGEGALWAITGWELDTIERIDPKNECRRRDHPARTNRQDPRLAPQPGRWRRCDLGVCPDVTVEDRSHDQARVGERPARPQRGRQQRRDRRRSRLGRQPRRNAAPCRPRLPDEWSRFPSDAPST